MFADIVGPDGLIILVVAVVVLLFGGKSLPKLARSLGSAQHEFRKGLIEDETPSPLNVPSEPVNSVGDGT